MKLGNKYIGPNLKYSEILGELQEDININTGLDIP